MALGTTWYVLYACPACGLWCCLSHGLVFRLLISQRLGKLLFPKKKEIEEKGEDHPFPLLLFLYVLLID